MKNTEKPAKLFQTISKVLKQGFSADLCEDDGWYTEHFFTQILQFASNNTWQMFPKHIVEY
jgi:hypothetical protein